MYVWIQILFDHYCINHIHIFLRKCPVILTTALARETYLRVSSCNLDETLAEFASEKEGSSVESLDSNKDGERQETQEKVPGIASVKYSHQFRLPMTTKKTIKQL